MKTKNGKNRGGFSLVEMLVMVAIIGLMAALVLPMFQTKAQGQTNMNLANTAPYFSISNSVLLNVGVPLVNDLITNGVATALVSNTYTNGTNYNGGTILPFSVTRGNSVALALQVTTTNSGAKGTYTAYFDEGTGAGDWVSWGTAAATASGAGTVSGSTPTNSFGYTTFRLNHIASTETNTGTGGAPVANCATLTISFSSKSGF